MTAERDALKAELAAKRAAPDSSNEAAPNAG
jgi:hypothetical protein